MNKTLVTIMTLVFLAAGVTFAGRGTLAYLAKHQLLGVSIEGNGHR